MIDILQPVSQKYAEHVADLIVQTDERMWYMIANYVMPLNFMATTQMYVAMDFIEKSPLYCHNVSRYVKLAFKDFEKYEEFCKKGYETERAKFLYSDFNTFYNKEFAPYIEKIRAEAMNLLNDRKHPNAAYIATMVVTDTMLYFASRYHSTTAERCSAYVGGKYNYKERYKQYSMQPLYNNWHRAVQALCKIDFLNHKPIADIVAKMTTIHVNNQAANKAARTAIEQNKENYPDMYAKTFSEDAANKLKQKYKVKKSKKK